MKYIKSLEAVGFQREQAEAQVQMVLDAIEGDLVTKSDFAIFQERIENKLESFEHKIESKLESFENKIENKFAQFTQSLTQSLDRKLDQRFAQNDLRFAEFDQNIVRIDRRFEQFQLQLKELEFRLTTRLGFLMVSTASIAIAVLTWLIKL